ncbi:hypothetical protein CPB83DRAFT_862335 [Crepidotus variabilis]|uniref:Uncharacterized protein n=1 Tax=Crepidotus variabilis TaxID=179855 RepID=A0A9P6JJY3_9AGAR|nr:hypothetical protein CPB83DRAFT_862335 [Crepidotus variabilis]
MRVSGQEERTYGSQDLLVFGCIQYSLLPTATLRRFQLLVPATRHFAGENSDVRPTGIIDSRCAKYLDGLDDSGTSGGNISISTLSSTEHPTSLVSPRDPTTESQESVLGRGEILRRAAKKSPRDISIIETLLAPSQLGQSPKVISKLTEFDEVVRSTVDFLAGNIIYRPSEAFEDELTAAESDLTPVLGQRLASLLATEAAMAESLNGSKPPKAMIYMASQTLLVGCLCQMIPANMSTSSTTTPAHASKISLLNKFRNMFKIASWALPSAGLRSTFEGHLTRSLHASDDLDRATLSISGSMGSMLNVAPLLGLNFGVRNLQEEKGTQEEIERLKDDVRKAQQNTDKYALELQKSQLETKTFYNNFKGAQHETYRLHDQVQRLEHELKIMSKKYEDTKLISDARGKELVGAQVFLNKADSLSVSDLVQKVNGLNEEIFQAAASLEEVLRFSKHDITEEKLQKRADYTCGLIGQPLAQFVHKEAQKPGGAANPLLVQITIQVCLTAFCAVKIQTWAAGERAIDQYLKKLYSEIHASTDQAVAGRWRALTRAQLRSNTDNWGSELEHDLRALLAVASWNAPTEQQGSFTSKLPAIIRAVEDVKVSLSEKFTSADIEITSIHPKTAFIKAIMEESYGEDAGSGNDVVIATTGLGLAKVVQSNQGSDIHYENLLLPKVVLESSLKAALEPPPPRKRIRKITKGF